MSLLSEICRIGGEMVQCPYQCSAIVNDQKSGILPRGLYLEPGDCCAALSKENEKKSERRHNIINAENCTCGECTNGLIVIGINPEKSDDIEIDFYRNEFRKNKEKTMYPATVDFFETHLSGPTKGQSQYYSKIRGLVRGIGFNGPLLWTEIIKCESSLEPKNHEVFNQMVNNYKRMPIQTRTAIICGKLYLERELQAAPKGWPIIAIGGFVFEVMSNYHNLGRAVIGIPHPTGSRGHFGAAVATGKQKFQGAIIDKETKWLGRKESQDSNHPTIVTSTLRTLAAPPPPTAKPATSKLTPPHTRPHYQTSLNPYRMRAARASYNGNTLASQSQTSFTTPHFSRVLTVVFCCKSKKSTVVR